MDFNLSEELTALRETARQFAEKEVAPYAEQWEEAGGYPSELFRKMGDLGFFGAVLPEEYGGSNMGFLAVCLITEELTKASGSLRTAINMHSVGTALSIYRSGTEEQKRKYIPALISGRELGCFAITEPEAGADVLSMKTTATEQDGHYVINGTKTWITYGHLAKLIIVYAYHDKNLKSRGLSSFLVDGTLPGITAKPLRTLGASPAPAAEVRFENVRVPKDAILGRIGDGLRNLFSTLNQTRLVCAAGALGLAQACLHASVRYCNERVQFGEPIGKFQMNQDKIAQMTTEIEASRLLIYKAACQKDQGNVNNTTATSMAKYHAAKTALLAADYAMSIYGAYGYSLDFPIAKFYREAKGIQIIEGSDNIHKMIIAMDRLGYRKADR